MPEWSLVRRGMRLPNSIRVWRMWTEDQATRTALYEEAMKLILDLAVELPVYQRSTVYVYNANVINSETMPKASEMNPYTSPLDRIWEIEFAN